MNKNIIFLIIFSMFLLTPFIAKGAVVINEIAWMGTIGNQYGEWLELYNTGTEEIDLNNWKLYKDKDGSSVLVFTLSKKITSEGYLVIERTTDSSPDPLPGIDDESGKFGGGNLINLPGGEHLVLKNAEGFIIEDLDFSNGWPKGKASPDYKTMERKSPQGAGNDPNNWQTSLEPGGTPKAQNSSGAIEEPEESGEPEGESEQPADSPDSEAGETETPSGSGNRVPIADAGNDIIAFIGDEITFDGSKSRDPDEDELIFTWNLGEGTSEKGPIVSHKYFYPGTYLVTLMVFDGRDLGKDTVTVEIYPKQITINEFLPSPSGKDAEEEWIEIYNDSNSISDISGWQLDDEDGGSKPFTFPENTLIAPKSYLVFSRKVTKIALNNDADKVRLLLSTGIVFQEVSYGKAPEGKSSSRTPEGFVWSMPTPGLPNIAGIKDKEFSYNKPLQSETTDQPSEDITAYYKNIPEDSIKGGWVYLPPSQKNFNNEDLSQYNLANIGKSTDNNTLILIIITIVATILTIGVVVLKLKKKNK